ncbi:MAG TPA: hypothetical protein VMD75_16080, partial [Candidatus Binataceae bacterium]|nr:hypothetical protein [Candidatus Binataceae bacterium]
MEVSANRPPWNGTGIKLAEGDCFTLFCAGRAWLTAIPEVWVDAHFGLWIRVGTRAPMFRVPRGSLTFTAPHAGELYLANLFPGAWGDENGALASPPSAFEKVAGAFEVLIIRWRSDAHQGLQRMAEQGGPAAELAAEEVRACRNPVTPPRGWKYLWSTGDAEAFRADDEGRIRCEIIDDGTILQRPVSAPFTPSTRLRWSWKVDQLPSSRAEDSV